MRKPKEFPVHLRKVMRDLLAVGGRIARDGSNLLIDGPPAAAASIAALHAHVGELAAHLVPSVTPEDAAMTRELLADAGARIEYVGHVPSDGVGGAEQAAREARFS